MDRVRPHCIQEGSWCAGGTKCSRGITEFNTLWDGPRGAGAAPKKNNLRRPPQETHDACRTREHRRWTQVQHLPETQEHRRAHVALDWKKSLRGSLCASDEEPSAAPSDTKNLVLTEADAHERELPIVMKSYKDLARSAGCRVGIVGVMMLMLILIHVSSTVFWLQSVLFVVRGQVCHESRAVFSQTMASGNNGIPASVVSTPMFGSCAP